MSTLELAGNLEKNPVARSFFSSDTPYIRDFKAGEIVPIINEPMLPSDDIELNLSTIIRQMPTMSPSFSQSRLSVRAFFVAIRNLDRNFSDWLSGYKEYSDMTKYEEDIPRWIPETYEEVKGGSLWEALGYPRNVIPDNANCPYDYGRQAYNYCYDQYMRNQTVMKSIMEDGVPGTSKNKKILMINKDRDYFTTALPYQQLSDPIALPIVGDSKAVWDENNNLSFEKADMNTWAHSYLRVLGINSETNPKTTDIAFAIGNTVTRDQAIQNVKDILSNNIVRGEDLTAANISMIRNSGALQLFAEMNARGGILYNELLLTHWGTCPSDETLGRPIYLGGGSIQILTSEVLQTSSSTDEQPLGQLGGHGLGVGELPIIRYRAKEFGILIVVAYVKTGSLYGNQGINPKYLWRTKFEIPFTVLQHLSEQPVRKAEILCKSIVKFKKDGTIYKNDEETKKEAEQHNNDIFGYRPIFDAYRYNYGTVAGLVSRDYFYNNKGEIERIDNLSHWTEAYFFNPESPPALNQDFMEYHSDMRNYAVVEGDEAVQFIIYFNRNVRWWRPLTLLGTPGRFDHIL